MGRNFLNLNNEAPPLREAVAQVSQDRISENRVFAEKIVKSKGKLNAKAALA